MVVKFYFASQEESTETIDMTNDVHSDKQPRIDDDFITSDEEQRYQRAASLDKLVDYCVEEFGKPLFIPVSIKHGLRTVDYGLRTADWV